jgi:hypothetical protein
MVFLKKNESAKVAQALLKIPLARLVVKIYFSGGKKFCLALYIYLNKKQNEENLHLPPDHLATRRLRRPAGFLFSNYRAACA